MNLSRFFSGWVLLALALVGFYFVSDPFVGSNNGLALTGAIAKAIGSIIGGLAVGLIVWAPLRLIQGADKAPDPLSFFLLSCGNNDGHSDGLGYDPSLFFCNATE